MASTRRIHPRQMRVLDRSVGSRGKESKEMAWSYRFETVGLSGWLRS